MASSIDSVTATIPSTSTSATTSTSSGQTSTPLDRQAFLKLLVAQISHQDPLQPMEGTEFVTQLSQFAAVEQAVAQSASLQTLSTQIGGVANNEATSLVGKQVSMRGQAMTFDGTNATSSSVTLQGAATKMSADVVDANGNIVRTIDLGAHAPGAVTITWDGKTQAGASAPAGNYSLKVHATAQDGSPISTTQDVTGTVTKVTFDKGYPELTLDNGAIGPISDLVSVQGK